MKTSVCFAMILFAAMQFGLALAQEKQELIQQRIEFLSEHIPNEDFDLSNLLDALNYFFDHPLNLNQANKEELQELNLLNDWQINSILLHREINGKLISLYELQGLNYWDIATIELVLPFVRVDDKLDQVHVSAREIMKYAHAEFLLRYQLVPEKKSGYEEVSDSVRALDNAYYYGNSGHYYTRFRYYYRTNMSVGITAEKDPGEQFFLGPQKKGFDFYSAHLFFKGGKYIQSLALGDYQVQIGQGLNCWTGYGFGKTADLLTTKKNAVPLRPYTSADEFNFFRGAAINVGLQKFSWLNFVSVKKLDASLVLDSICFATDSVASIVQTGLHRTNAELNKRGVLAEKLFGSSLRYSDKNFSIGLSSVYKHYNLDFSKLTAVYNQFNGDERSSFTIGSDYSAVLKNIHVFGEVVYRPHTQSWAQLHGLLIALDAKCMLGLAYRNYGRAYHGQYTNGFSESSKVQNEQGLFGGFKLKCNQKWSLQGYYDFFRFPWLKFQVDAPSTGNEYLLQTSYKPNKKMEFYLRYRNEKHEKNYLQSGDKLARLANQYQHNIRLHWTLGLNDVLILRNRIEFVFLNKPDSKLESGMLIYQDVSWKPKNIPIELFLRYALFETDSYDSRIYSYENNAQYIYAVPAYYYQGNRFVAMINYSFLKHFDLWLRYGVSLYEDKTAIGTGAEQILGNRKTDLTFQLRLKF